MELSAVEWIIIALAAVAVFGVLVAFFARRERSEPTGDPYVEALGCLIDGNRRAAYEKLQQAVRSGFAPNDAYIRLGALLRENGDANKALQIHRSLTVKSDLTRAEKVELFTNIAEDYAALGRADLAVDVLDTALRRMNLREPVVYRILARESHRRGKYEEAYGYLKELKRTDAAGDRELALYLATAGEEQARAGQTKEARRTLQKALKHDAGCAPAMAALADIESAAGDEDRAIEHWKQVARLSPELSPSALANLERVLFERGKFSEIERVYQDILVTRPKDEHATVSLASFYRKQGRVSDAIEQLEEFYGTQTDSVGAAMLLISLYAAAGDQRSLETFLEENEPAVQTPGPFACDSCGRQSAEMRWHCPVCNHFDSHAPVSP